MNGLQEQSISHALRAAPCDLLVFADDWGRHPSSAQHLISHLLPKYPVTWVNTIGTRPPRLDWKTIARGMEKLREWSSPGPGATLTSDLAPQVIAPRMWPWFRKSWDRR